jgi:hypothetical protein
MANGSVYFKWVNKKTSGGKIKYLLEFLKNTGKEIKYIFTNRNDYSEENDDLDKTDEKIQIYSCPDCRPREKKIKEQAKRIEELEYTVGIQKELIENLRGGNEVKKENLSSDSSQFGEGAKGNKAS